MLQIVSCCDTCSNELLQWLPDESKVGTGLELASFSTKTCYGACMSRNGMILHMTGVPWLVKACFGCYVATVFVQLIVMSFIARTLFTDTKTQESWQASHSHSAAD